MPKRDGGDLARTLLGKAAQDEFALRHLATLTDSPDEVLGFHAQQAAEKLVKAVLAARAIRYERSHDLRYLIELLQEAGVDFPLDPDRVDELTDFAVPLRYEDPSEQEPLDRSTTLELITALRGWAERAVEP